MSGYGQPLILPRETYEERTGRNRKFVAGMLFGLSEVLRNSHDKNVVAVVVKGAGITSNEAESCGIDPADFNEIARACGWNLLPEGDAKYVEGMILELQRPTTAYERAKRRKLLEKLDDGRWSVQDVDGGRVTKASEATLDRDYERAR